MDVIVPLDHKCDWGLYQLVKEWSNNDLCTLHRADTSYVWVNGVGEILLWDRDTLRSRKTSNRVNGYRIPNFKKILVANKQPSRNIGMYSEWTYFTKFPSFTEEVKDELRIKNRTHKIVWCGTRRRTRPVDFIDDYADNCDLVHISGKKRRRLSQPQYYDKLSSAKFGLCLKGLGPKCHREIELMSVGTVPIVTPGVCLKYYDKLAQNKHYLFARNPNEVNKVIKSANWEEMSQNCIDWYERNCSITGSFELTKRIIGALR